jgi:hypothetical protein
MYKFRMVTYNKPHSCPTGIPAKNSCDSGKKQEFLRPPPKPRYCEKFLRKTGKKRNPQESWQEWFFCPKNKFLKTGICNLANMDDGRKATCILT